MAPDPKKEGEDKAEKVDKVESPKPAQTPEERRKALRELGITPKEDIAAENAKMFEKGAREYIKRRLPEYRKLLDDLEKELEAIEKAAASWAEAKDPAAAHEAFRKKLGKRTAALTKRYDELTGHGAQGGNTQAILGKAYRTFERILEVLDPKVGQNPEFKALVQEVRTGIEKVRAALDEIEKDPTLDPKAGKKAAGKGGKGG